MSKDKDRKIQVEAATRLCHQIARDVNAHTGLLTVRFVLHRDGHRKEAMELALHDLAPHVPSHLLKTFRETLKYNFEEHERSTVLGAFVQAKNICFGISSRMQCLAICSVNLDEAGTTADVGRLALHHAWHLMSFIDQGDIDETVTAFYAPKNIFPHTVEHRALANLKADIFSVSALSFLKQGNLVRALAKTQSLQVLSPISAEQAENCLFPVAAEVVESAVGQTLLKPMSQKRVIGESLKLTQRIYRTLGENIGIWHDFLNAAQTMAWRGYDPSDILESAILTSSNTKIRMFGHLVAENVGITIKKMPDEQNMHSAFTPESYNAILHYNACLAAFSEALMACIENSNGDAMRRLARLQNSRLIGGHVIGWCAQALWNAANAFDHEKDARQRDLSARDIFKREQSKTAWESLSALAAYIVDQKRQGKITDKSTVLDFGCEDANYAQICSAVRHIGDIDNDFSQRRPSEPVPDLQVHARHIPMSSRPLSSSHAAVF